MRHARIDRREQTLVSLAVIALVCLWPAAALADNPTPTAGPTPGVTAESSPRPTLTPPRPTVTSTRTPVAATAAVKSTPAVEPTNTSTRRRHPRREHHTVTPTPKPHRHHHKAHHKAKRRKHKHKATATPTPSPTPDINLQTEDSVTPVTCNGSERPNASRPFLDAPYRGWTSIVSYFDHDMPNFEVDGTIQTSSGASAKPESLYSAADFPAYWNSNLRQFLYYDGHNGYDFNLWYQPVYAAAPGKVIFAAFEYPTMPDHGYGKMVMIDHRNGYVTLYGHFSRLMVRKGQRVKRGQQIGISGNTGHSSGPHLHFTVFHNCSPTDPYGWGGAGDDPLQGYQGETSEFLWKRPPLVSNPLPGWPHVQSLPAGSITRIALLDLPSTREGTKSFSRALDREVEEDALALRKRGLFVKVDPLKGALTVSGTFTAQELYSLPHVASITTPDTEEGDRDDVLHALAEAALVSKHARIPVARSSAWRGYLLRWHHRTFLVGAGVKGGDVDLRLAENGRQVSIHHLKGDARSGAFATDLGDLSKRQATTLTRELEGKGSGGSSITSRVKAPPAKVVSHSSRGWSWLLLFLLLLLLASGLAWFPPVRTVIFRRMDAP